MSTATFVIKLGGELMEPAKSDELAAIWMYLRSLPPQSTPKS